jgi:hypothetical protein
MRFSVVLAMFCGGLVALFACSGSNGGQPAVDDAGGAPPEASAPQQDASGSVPDGNVHGGHADAGVDPDASLAVDASGNVKVKFAKACWQVDNGKSYQAIHFDLTTPAPVTLKGVLFADTKCDPTKVTVTNDNVATIPSGSYAYWFVDHPDDTMTSATWTIEGETTGCVDYQHAQDCR